MSDLVGNPEDRFSQNEAHLLLLVLGVDQDSIRTSYKRLALKWHPDKHSGSGEALKVKKCLDV